MRIRRQPDDQGAATEVPRNSGQPPHPDRPLFAKSLGVMAAANALVMLGLLPEPRAEAILAGHRQALERKGLGNVWGVTKGELTVRPGAHGYWQSRKAGPGGLR